MADEKTPKVDGNIVVDPELSEVQRNQLNTVEKRLERVEAKVFPKQQKPASTPPKK